MFEPSRHYPLKVMKWEPERARETVAEVAQAAASRLSETGRLPRHPLDDHGVGSDLYMGVTGVVWALAYLKRVQAIAVDLNFASVLKQQLSANESDLQGLPHPANASYLFGELPILLLQFKLSGDKPIADRIFRSIEKNNTQPVRELMWGTAGSMLCANFMHQWTSEDRWKQIFLLQAERLLNEWERIEGIGYLWSPDLYGHKRRYLGAVHGFAGNLIPLIEGRRLLGEERYASICTKIFQTVVGTATANERQANWVAVFEGTDRTGTPMLVQHCHGAPGMVTALSKLPRDLDSRFDQVLEKAGELTWHAGPLRKGSNLCHGTAGNGYAFLKLYRRSGDELWLQRARAFAMNAIDQYRRAREFYRQGRHSLWTGDLGMAVYLWDCVNVEANFPTIDVF